MPKRPPTPDTGPDLVKLLAVWRPYPPHANLEHKHERADFLSWIVGCLGNDAYLHAIAWKPRTPTTVLIEVSRDFEPWERLLGEHKWSEVFRTGFSSKDADNTSMIFYSTFHDHRAAEKAGWKILYIDDAFIKENVHRDICNDPYPKTRWCAAPELDKTNGTIHRPLPLELFKDTAPAPAPRVVVGSAAWASGDSGANGSRGGKAPAPGRGRGGQPPARGGPTPARGAWAAGRPAIPRTSASAPAASPSTRPQSGPTSPSAVRSAWGPPPRSATTSVAGSAGSTRVTGSAWSSVSGSSVSATETVVDPFYDDDEDHSTLTSMSQTATGTKLFSSDPHTNTGETNPTSKADEVTVDVEDVWANDPKDTKNANDEKYHCPVHLASCSPHMCAYIEAHLAKLGVKYRDIKDKSGGPSNIYTIERQEKKERLAENPRNRGRGRGERGRRPNPAADNW